MTRPLLNSIFRKNVWKLHNFFGFLNAKSRTCFNWTFCRTMPCKFYVLILKGNQNTLFQWFAGKPWLNRYNTPLQVALDQTGPATPGAVRTMAPPSPLPPHPNHISFVLCPVWHRCGIDLKVDLSFILNKKDNIFLKNEDNKRLWYFKSWKKDNKHCKLKSFWKRMQISKHVLESCGG